MEYLEILAIIMEYRGILKIPDHKTATLSQPVIIRENNTLFPNFPYVSYFD